MRPYFLLTVLLISYLSHAQSGTFLVSNIDSELRKNANAVVRLNKMEVTIEARNQMRISSKRIVTVLNEKGNGYVHAYTHYEKNDKVNQIEAIVYNALGQEIKKIRKKDFEDRSAVSGGTLYSDSRVLFLNYTPTSYPYTIEFTREFVTPNTAFIPTWSFLDGYNVSTEKSDFSVMVKNQFPFRSKEVNFEGVPITVSKSDEKLSYVATHLKAFKQEVLSPPFNEFAPIVKVSLDKFHLEGVDGTATSWKEFGKWMYEELIEGRDEINPVTIAKVKTMVRGIQDPREKIRVVYDYVQNNTRYISVQLGIGGWMPISASIVDKVKYGDCKGLTNYTKALLKAVGVESYYTVVYAGQNAKDLDPDFPSMQGNHIILNIPINNEETWLECTSQIIPPNFLGDFTDNRTVLKVKPDGGEIIKTTKYLNEDNYQFTSAEYYLGESGDLKGELEISSRGSKYYRKFRLAYKPEKEKEKHYKEYWDYINNIVLGTIAFENDKQQVNFKESVVISASNYASKTNEQLLFAPNAFNRSSYVPKRYRIRNRALLIQRGYLDEDNFIIHLPNGYRIESMIKNEEIKNKFGHYTISLEQIDDKTLRYKRKLLVKSGKYPKEDYGAYRNFRRQVARFDNTKIILTKT